MTLTANPAARQALAKKKTEHRLVFVRGRTEALPGAGQLQKVMNIENSMGLLQFDKANELMDEVDEALERYQRSLEQAEMETAAQAQDQHLANHGVDTARTDSGVGQRHGLLWLIAKKRLNTDRKTAGLRWSDDYSLVRENGLKSCLNDNGAGSTATPESERALAARHTVARQRLDQARSHILWSTGSTRLVNLLDAVCGRGETLRSLVGNDKDRAIAIEAELMIALDMAGVSYGVVKIAA